MFRNDPVLRLTNIEKHRAVRVFSNSKIDLERWDPRSRTIQDFHRERWIYRRLENSFENSWKALSHDAVNFRSFRKSTRSYSNAPKSLKSLFGPLNLRIFKHPRLRTALTDFHLTRVSRSNDRTLGLSFRGFDP